MSSVARDMAALIYLNSYNSTFFNRMMQTSNNSSSNEESFSQKFYKQMRQHEMELKEQEEAFNDISTRFQLAVNEKAFMGTDILSDLYDIFHEYGSSADRLADVELLINSNSDFLKQHQLISLVREYATTYEKTYSLILDKAQVMRETGELMRDDKLVYAFSQVINAKTGREQLSVFSASAWEEFEKQGRNVFELITNEKGELKGISTRQEGLTRGEISSALSQNSGYIIDDIMSKQITPNLIDGKQITYNDVWQKLLNTQIETKEWRNNNGTIDPSSQFLSGARKAELLMSGKFTNIQSEQDIDKIINSFQGKISMSENISGWVAGDNTLVGKMINQNGTIMQQQISVQNKRMSGGLGWNGIGMQGLVMGFNVLSNQKEVEKILDIAKRDHQNNTHEIYDYFKDNYGFATDDEVEEYFDNFVAENATDEFISMAGEEFSDEEY